MRNLILSFFAILNIGSLLGQESYLYRNDGDLLVDTIFSIDTNRINEVIKFEKFILPDIYNKISYPTICSDNSIYGIEIAKIKIDKDTAIFVEICKSSDSVLSETVKKVLNTTFLKFELDYWMPFLTYPVEFYIPFKFEILPDTFKKDIVKKNSIVIKAFPRTLHYEKLDTVW